MANCTDLVDMFICNCTTGWNGTLCGQGKNIFIVSMACFTLKCWMVMREHLNTYFYFLTFLDTATVPVVQNNLLSGRQGSSYAINKRHDYHYISTHLRISKSNTKGTVWICHSFVAQTELFWNDWSMPCLLTFLLLPGYLQSWYWQIG